MMWQENEGYGPYHFITFGTLLLSSSPCPGLRPTRRVKGTGEDVVRGEDTNRGRKCSGGIRTGYYRSILCSLVKEGPYRVNQPWKQITCGAVISLLPQVLLQSYHHLFTWHRSPNSLLTSVRSVPHLFSSSRPGPSGSRSLRARGPVVRRRGKRRTKNRWKEASACRSSVLSARFLTSFTH